MNETFTQPLQTLQNVFGGLAGSYMDSARSSTREPKIGDRVLVHKNKEGVIIALSWDRWNSISKAKIKHSDFFYGTSWEDVNYLDYLSKNIDDYDLQAGNKN